MISTLFLHLIMTTPIVPFALTLIFSTAFLAACSEKAAPTAASSAAQPGVPASSTSALAAPSATGATAAPAGAPVSVTTAKATQRDIAVTIKATGTITPISSVDVKPQVTSVVMAVNFKEGQFVKRGDLLFTLDSRTDEANLAKAKAQLAKDEAALADAKRQLARNQDLVSKAFISQGAADTSQSNVDGFSATVTADKAAIDAAMTALSYNRITAAQAGRVGAINVFAGSAVQANQTTMVTITQLDPIAVAFNLPQSSLGDALGALKGEGTLVTAKLPDGVTTASGKLKFVDNAVDASSGTIKMKAIFGNKESKLWPGGFADVTLTSRTIKDAIVIPQAAIIQNARGTIVYVVEGDKDSKKAVLRPVKVLFGQSGEAAVSGVKEGESVVVDGKQNIRPNSPVVERAKPAPSPSGGASSPVGSASASAPTAASAASAAGK
jgi:RND family efflux transporter MFP subunit